MGRGTSAGTASRVAGRALAALAAIWIAVAVVPAPARATVTTVDCTLDSQALRTAVTNAANGDTLRVLGTCEGPVDVTAPYATELTFTGVGEDPTLSGGGLPLEVESGSTLTVANLTITGGYFSGIQSAGTLTLTHCTVTNNYGWTHSHAGASGTVGGIYSTGTLTIIDSTVTGNNGSTGLGTNDNPGAPGFPGGAGGPGGIDSHGSLTIIASTVSGNAGGMGGAGGFGIPPGPDGPAGVGGIVGTGTVSATIVADNTNPVGASDCQGSLTSLGYNLIGSTTGCTFAATPTDLTGTSATPLNAQLAALADNGGKTPTMAVAETSPAIDLVPTGDEACPPDDQRGFSRPQRSGCDAGSFELSAPGTALSIKAPRRIAAGSAAIVRGTLDPVDPKCARGQRIDLIRGRKRLASGRTDADGGYSLHATIVRTSTIHTRFAGTPTCGPSVSESRTIRAT